MTTHPDNPKPLQYDFFEADLWQARIDSIDDAIDATFKLFHRSLPTFNGLSINKLKQVIRDASGIHINLDDEQSVDFLHDLLKRLSQSLPEETTHIGWSADFDFELKQMLNLYMLTNTINNFFWGKLRTVTTNTLHSHTTQLPPVHLIRSCFRELTIDVEIIQNALIQRVWAIDTNGNTFPSAQSKSLVVMDKLALLSLAPIQHLLSDDSSITPITYISQKTHIRQIPYTKQVLLISVSYDRVSLPVNKRAYGNTNLDDVKDLPAFELMAIPHEVAHYLYNHEPKFQELSTRFKEDPYYHWCEELFADIYGCIVTGPLTAMGLQAMLATGNKDQVWKDDEEHPTPIIRPYILSEILRMLSDETINTICAQKYNFTKVADMLDGNWTAILQRWGFELTETNSTRPTLIKIHDNSQAHVEQYVNVTQLLQGVKPLATEFIKKLLTVMKLNPWQSEMGIDANITFPCCQENESTSTDYYAEMIKLTNYEFASKQIPSYLLSETYLNYDRIQASTPEGILQNCLENWGEKGPHGWGDHG